MLNFFISLSDSLKQNKNVMIVGIAAVSGSAPRGTGAKMLVGENGRICGTIGGGSVEYEAIHRAMALLKQKNSDIQSFLLSPNKIKDLGMVCGGEVTIYFQYISHSCLALLDLTKDVISMINNNHECWLITGITDGQIGVYCPQHGFSGIDKLNLNFTDTPQFQIINGQEFLVEPLVRNGIVYVFGGGHISQALVPIAAKVGFKCFVFDDRDEFTKPDLFPVAAKISKINFNDITKDVNITKNDYVIIMTRGHQYDSILQAQAMRTEAKYIGVIGSKSKIAHVSSQMRDLGFTDADLARVNSPIGIDIKAETPEEIAISIVAELILVRASV